MIFLDIAKATQAQIIPDSGAGQTMFTKPRIAKAVTESLAVRAYGSMFIASTLRYLELFVKVIML